MHQGEQSTIVPAERFTTVAIVGAGYAGLAAARALTAAGVDVLVLEARDRVGGKTFTRPAQDGTNIDLGGQWIGPTQHRLAALAQAVGATTYPTYDTGNNIEMRDGERFLYSGAIPTADPSLAMETVERMLDLNIMAQSVPLDAPWTAPNAAEWDGQTVATWIEANVPTPAVRNVLVIAVRAIFCIEPSDLSLLHFLFYIHSAGSLNELVGIKRGAQERRFHAGAQSVALRVAAELGERVLLNAPVHTIHHSDASVRVVSDRLSVRAERVVVAMAPTLAGRLRYRPALPALRDQLTQRVPMGTTIKVHCLYPTPFWRDEGLSGQAISNTSVLSATFDNSPESGVPGVLLGFVEGQEGRRWSAAPPEERRAAILAAFVEYFGERAAQPSEYIEYLWANEEYSRGCYSGYMPPGVWTAYGPALREPVGRIHWAGTETATVWNGYIDGAVQSGERVAEELLALLG